MNDESALLRWRRHFEQFLGRHYYHHPDLPHLGFSPAKSAALVQIAHHDVDLGEELVLVDTRPTLHAVLEQLGMMEREFTGEVDGPWDEYLRVMPPNARAVRFPRHYRALKVYVSHGGNEGIYLHVEMAFPRADRDPTTALARAQTLAGWPIDTHHMLDDDLCLFLGKSLGHTWSDCYASSGRIAHALGA